MVKNWGQTFECVKKAVEEKFLIIDETEDAFIDFVIQNDEEPTRYLHSLSSVEQQLFERQYVLLQQYQQHECDSYADEQGDQTRNSQQYCSPNKNGDKKTGDNQLSTIKDDR